MRSGVCSSGHPVHPHSRLCRVGKSDGLPAPWCDLGPSNQSPKPRRGCLSIIDQNLASSQECPLQKQDRLAQSQQAFVTTFDSVIDKTIVSNASGTVIDALIPLIDSGEFPALTQTVAYHLGQMVDDEFDPDREALIQLMAIDQARGVLQGEDLLDLFRYLLADASIEKILHDAAGLLSIDDHERTFAASLLGLLGNALGDTMQPVICQGFSLDGFAKTLLHPTGLGPTHGLSVPAWTVRADLNGNPQVEVNPSTETLYEPFVDRNGDLAADTNHFNIPVDWFGSPIDLPVFGHAGQRDEYERALAADGALIYTYLDASDTTLSYLLQLLGEAFANHLHHDLFDVIAAALGEPISCGTDCQHYSPDNNPVADLVFSVIEDLRYEKLDVLLKTWNVVMRTQPQLAEAVLASVGRMLVALEQSGHSSERFGCGRLFYRPDAFVCRCLRA